MLGVTVNFFAVLVGGVAGTLLRGGIPERFRTLVNQGLAICVMMIGISGKRQATSSIYWQSAYRSIKGVIPIPPE